MNRLKVVDTFTATIYVGAKEHHANIVHTYEEAKEILQEYCDVNPRCFTLKQVEYIYTDGNEIGFEIGMINYPRFPDDRHHIICIAMKVAEIFKEKFKQYKVTIVFSDETYMFEDIEGE